MRVLRWLPTLLLTLPWLVGPVQPSIDARVRDLAGPSTFHLLDWETVHIRQNLGGLWAGLFGSVAPRPSDPNIVRSYFAEPVDRRGPLRAAAEPALDRLVSAAYASAGLARNQPLALPNDNLFPPVLVSLTEPPNVLVVAPRSALRVQSSTVMGALDQADQEQLETSVESNGSVAALVAPIGGLATYPSMVLDEPLADRVLIGVAHEWLHQYLIFYPLGQGYFSDQQTREINETTADLVSQEIGTHLQADLGLTNVAPPRPAAPRPGPEASAALDFRAFMQSTRAQTEVMLARGDVESAEAFMRSQRDELQRHGYAIRKLNQAYFALYGSYGDGFAASPASRIPDLLRRIRAQSSSLGEFVTRIRGVRTIADLDREAAS